MQEKNNNDPVLAFSPGFASKSIQEKLLRLGITCEIDLIMHLPLRYEDETHVYPIIDVVDGKTVQVEGVITHTEVMYRPRRQLVCQVTDGSGTLYIRFLNFYGSQIKTLAIDKRLRVLGEVRQGFFGTEMVHPTYRIVQEGEPLAQSLTPVYPTTTGLSQKVLRKLIGQVLSQDICTTFFAETLPDTLLSQQQMVGFKDSVMLLHQPPPNVPADSLQARSHPAWQRIKFDELLSQQLSMRLHYQHRRSHCAPALSPKNTLTQALLSSLVFELTQAQKKTLAEVSHDLALPHPMQRLLQGDVGSGKTVVAALAALQAIENGYQAALMAPTEILAEQHFNKLSAWLEPLNIVVVWLSGSLKKKQKEAAMEAVESGDAKLAIGTHALFQEQVEFKQLGLAIIDEQHRFGVHQRLELCLKGNKNGVVPHQLMMSATPIPRTLSMSYYADLDVSVIDELPPGRTPVVTKLIADNRRDEIIERIYEACRTGKQVYWVCPLIEESEKLQLKTANETFERLSELLPEVNIGMIHGRLQTQEKSVIMDSFKQGETQLLVATTVIEVGVDVPNASLMVIEHAERMGLSQLHQLRGRVGRGSDASVCILMYQMPLSDIARKRLKIIFKHTDGFEIARHDLNLRGPGEFLGARQSGVPMLRFADIEQDFDLLNAAQSVADEILSNYPQQAQQHLQRWLGKKKVYLRV